MGGYHPTAQTRSMFFYLFYMYGVNNGKPQVARKLSHGPSNAPYFKQYRYDTYHDGDFVTLTNQRVASVIANQPFFSGVMGGLFLACGIYWICLAVTCRGRDDEFEVLEMEILFYFTKEIA